MSWGDLFGILKKIPIQDREERWKNKLDALEKEKIALRKGAWTLEKARRYKRIERDIDKLNQFLRNRS